MAEEEEIGTTEFGGVDEDDDKVKKRNDVVLKFLDSVDCYLVLFDSLSSTLRQGWMELASARHSMGASRISSASFDLKNHYAATKLEVTCHEDSVTKLPQFTLCKWTPPDVRKSYSNELTSEKVEISEKKSSDCRLQDQAEPQNSEHEGTAPTSNEVDSSDSPHAVDNSIQKERSKLLSMFGTLVYLSFDLLNFHLRRLWKQ